MQISGFGILAKPYLILGGGGGGIGVIRTLLIRPLEGQLLVGGRDYQVPRLIDERSLKSMQSPASQSFIDKGILLLILKVLHDLSIL